MELEIRDIRHQYPNGKQALKGISLKLQPGVYGLLGANGAGKSTLMNIITGNLIPSGGVLLLNGEKVSGDNADYRRHLGYMPQQQGIYPRFTGRRFLWYMAALKGMERHCAQKQIAELLRVVHLEEAADRKIGGYSGGMKQRLLIAQALLDDPEILVLDEPTAGLDPVERIRIRNFISGIARERIVLLATHVVGDVECIAGQMLLMQDGELIRQGTPMELTAELDGLVWEFLCDPSDMERVQKEHLVSSLTMTREGMRVRAVGERERFPENSLPTPAGMEEVYLYRICAGGNDENPNF